MMQIVKIIMGWPTNYIPSYVREINAVSADQIKWSGGLFGIFLFGYKREKAGVRHDTPAVSERDTNVSVLRSWPQLMRRGRLAFSLPCREVPSLFLSSTCDPLMDPPVMSNDTICIAIYICTELIQTFSLISQIPQSHVVFRRHQN